MKVLVFEWLTATGVGRDPGSPMHPTYREGRAMRDALVADARALPGWSVDTIDGAVPAEVEAELERRAAANDATILVAPETGGLLERLAGRARAARARVILPTADALRLAADKLALARHWREHGVRSPATTDRAPTPCEAFPVVWKPRDGAGSCATFVLTSDLQLPWAKARLVEEGASAEGMILQEFVPGAAASVAFLCGPAGRFPLPPASQSLSADGRFRYLGGSAPLPPEPGRRAVAIAAAALDCVPGLEGYVGVDVVLGPRADGRDDHAIEINPRLTTSYVAARRLSEVNLLEAMLRVAGGEAPRLRWRDETIAFTADGDVSLVSAPACD